jgi:hypothetical protein
MTDITSVNRLQELARAAARELLAKVPSAERDKTIGPILRRHGIKKAAFSKVKDAATLEAFTADVKAQLANPDIEPLPEPITVEQLLSGDYPRTKYSVDELVMQGVVNMLYGDGGTGKTTVAIQMGVAVAAGADIFGRATIKAPVLLVLAEDSEGETKPRAAAAINDLNISKPGDLDLEVWNLPGHDISISKISEEGTIALLPFYYKLEEKLKAQPGLFVVLDSLVDIAQMSEAQRLPVNAFFKKVLTGLCVKYGATMLVLGHPSKAAMADGTYYSGSTAYRNAVRNMIVMKVEKDTPFRSLERLKNNYAADEASIKLAWCDGIFVPPTDAAIASTELGKYRGVVKTILDLIGRGITVARANQAKGSETPKSLAKLITTSPASTTKITAREVEDFMRVALRNGDLKYVEAYGRTKAHFEPGDIEHAPTAAAEAAAEFLDDPAEGGDIMRGSRVLHCEDQETGELIEIDAADGVTAIHEPHPAD